MEKALIIFVKNPIKGKVKTRLAKSVGKEKALSVYMRLLQITKNSVLSLNTKKIVFYSEMIESEDLWTNSIFEKKVQKGENLGERMYQAIFEEAEEGAEKICLVGSDTPDMSAEIIKSAFEQLTNHDVVLGPAQDGGYYLIGMKKAQKKLFSNISWSTEFVFEETLSAIHNLNLSVALLPVLNDIDTIDDLKKFETDDLFL